MLFEHVDRLCSTDLLLDRCTPCCWLVASTNQRGIPFYMRVVNTGLACIREFLRTGLDDKIVTLRVPYQKDRHEYEYLRQAHSVRLARTATTNRASSC
jgi:hypothetical protein